MGDHRVSIKINFEMHGLKRKHECWLNWSDGIPEDFSRMIESWKDEAMERFLQEDMDYQEELRQQKLRQVEKEERATLKRLKEKYK